jgi:hypothetical protein
MEFQEWKQICPRKFAGTKDKFRLGWIMQKPPFDYHINWSYGWRCSNLVANVLRSMMPTGHLSLITSTNKTVIQKLYKVKKQRKLNRGIGYATHAWCDTRYADPLPVFSLNSVTSHDLI